MKNVILSVDFDDETNLYNVNAMKGSNVNESAFAMAVVIKCFVRSKFVNTEEDMIKLIRKYCLDPQYKEVEDERNNGDGENA